MFTRKRKFLFIVMTIAVVCGIVSVVWQGGKPRKPAEILPGDYSYTIEYAQHQVQGLMDQHHLPGAAIALIDDQDIIWQETFGLANIEENIQAESSTVFKLWSIAKVFTAIETMRLVDEGLVDLDVPITEYLPDFSIQSRFPDSEPITIRKILTHRSGLPRNECYWISLQRSTLVDLVNSLEDCYQAYPTGYRYKYSNIGYVTLGLLIEEVRGEPFPDYMLNNLLRPMGMESSAFLQSHLPPDSEIAYGYEFYEREYYPYEQNDTPKLPSGNFYSTLGDMGNFVKFIFATEKLGARLILGSEFFASMYTEQSSAHNDPQPMGLGWKMAHVLGSERLVWHDGGPGEGIGGLVAFLPDRKLGIVLIANSTALEGAISVPFALDILESMLETKYSVITPVEKPQEKVGIARAIKENYVGTYVAFGDVLQIFLKGDQLKAKFAGFTFDLDPQSETRFQPQHFLADLGLMALLNAPVDLRQLEIEFIIGDEINNDFMIISIGNISYEICPKYASAEQMFQLWEALSGDYELFARLPSGRLGAETLGTTSIQVEDDVLQMSGFVGPIIPISTTEIIILSGAFAGETMEYDPTTGSIYHQNIVFKRTSNSASK